jgi:phage gpG-like protein
MSNKFINFAERIREAIAKIPKAVGQIVVNHALDAFQKEELDGEKWKPSKDGTSGGERSDRRALLVKSGVLRGSIRIMSYSNTKVIVGSNVKYAGIQNQGGTTNPRVTEKSRKYFWALYEKTGNPKYKAMATTKQNTFKVEIPARPFLKMTNVLQSKIDKKVVQILKEAL